MKEGNSAETNTFWEALLNILLFKKKNQIVKFQVVAHCTQFPFNNINILLEKLEKLP